MLVTKALQSASGATRALNGANAVQAHYMEERCIAVDEKDTPIRSVSKRDCHHTSTATLHRAFSVFLFTPSEELVLQKRSATKITFPSLWTNSCCSHPLWNDIEMETKDALGIKMAAQRKLNHELGVGLIDIQRMSVMGRFLYEARMADGEWMEHELDYAVIVPDFDPKTLNPDPEEVSDVRLVSKEDLASMMITTSQFSPWFSLFYKEKWLSTWWDNLANLDRFADSKPVHKLQP